MCIGSRIGSLQPLSASFPSVSLMKAGHAQSRPLSTEIFFKLTGLREGVCDSHHAERVNGTYLQHLLRTVFLWYSCSRTRGTAPHTQSTDRVLPLAFSSGTQPCMFGGMFFACLSLCHRSNG